MPISSIESWRDAVGIISPLLEEMQKSLDAAIRQKRFREYAELGEQVEAIEKLIDCAKHAYDDGYSTGFDDGYDKGYQVGLEEQPDDDDPKAVPQ